MRQKTEIEMAKARLFKCVRTAVRTKHSLEADQELNEVLPKAEKEFDTAVLSGVLPKDALKEVLSRVL